MTQVLIFMIPLLTGIAIGWCLRGHLPQTQPQTEKNDG